MYKQSGVKTFLNALSQFLLRPEEMLEKRFDLLLKKMESGRSWLTQEEKNNTELNARQTRGLQRQREFINY